MSAGRPAQTFPTSDALTAAWRRIATSSRSLYQMGSASLWSQWRPKTTTKSTGDSWRQQNQHALLTPTAQLKTLKRGKATKRITYNVASEDELTAAWDDLTSGAHRTAWSKYDGQVFRRGDGIEIGSRDHSSSKSGNTETIDIRFVDGKRASIQIETGTK